MAKIVNLEPAEVRHRNCSLQYLGRDYSLGIATKAYYCIDHQEAFKIVIAIKKYFASQA